MKKISIRTYYTLFDKIFNEVKDKKYEGVVCILKGGFFLGTNLAYKLNLPSYFVWASYYDENNKKKNKVEISQYDKLKKGKYLLVDDIYDTGETVRVVQNLYKNIEFDICTLITKQEVKNLIYSKYDNSKDWIKFWWENYDK